MPVNEMLGYATSLISDLGLGSYLIALAVIGVALSVLSRFWGDR